MSAATRLRSLAQIIRAPKLSLIHRRFRGFTMIPRRTYVGNLELCRAHQGLSGAVVECGSWKGGMIAGVASLLGDGREYFLYDSFEGLPDAKPIDGAGATAWQQDKESPFYFENCRANEQDAAIAMRISGATKFHIVKGWFEKTLPDFPAGTPIAILRLDGDWYESTMACLENLYRHVIPGGIIIIDDYHTWDGCSRAVHDFLQRNGLNDRICQWGDDVAYIRKRGERFAATEGAH